MEGSSSVQSGQSGPKKARRIKPKELRLNTDAGDMEETGHDDTTTAAAGGAAALPPEYASHVAAATSYDLSQSSTFSTLATEYSTRSPTEHNTILPAGPAAPPDEDAIRNASFFEEEDDEDELQIDSSFALSFDPESEYEDDASPKEKTRQTAPKPQKIGAAVEAAVLEAQNIGAAASEAAILPSVPFPVPNPLETAVSNTIHTQPNPTTTTTTTTASAEPTLQSENSDEESEFQAGKEQAEPKKGDAGAEAIPTQASAAVPPTDDGESSSGAVAAPIQASAAVISTQSEAGESSTITEAAEKPIQETTAVVSAESKTAELSALTDMVAATHIGPTATVAPTESKSTPAQTTAAVASTDAAINAPLSTPAMAPPSKPPSPNDLTMEHYDLSDRDTFPGQLFRLLRDAKDLGIDSIMSWEDDGKTFRMHNEKKFLGLLLRLSRNKKVISFRNTLGQFNFQCIEFGANGRAFRHASAIPQHVKSDVSNGYGAILFHKNATAEQIQQIKRRASGIEHRKSSPDKKVGSPPLTLDTKSLKRFGTKKNGSPTLSLDAKSLKRMARACPSQPASTTSSPDYSAASDRNKRRRDPVYDLINNKWAGPTGKRRKRWLMAKEGSTEKLEDGTWTKPKGEPPARGLLWDEERGMWETVRKDVVDIADTTVAASAPTKRTDPSRIAPKNRKPVVVQQNDATFERLPRNNRKRNRNAERETRRRSDGCLYPRTRPARNEDGTFAKPSGNVPRGLAWDGVRGLWAPRGDVVSGSHSEGPARDSRQRRHAVQPDLPTSVSIRQPVRQPARAPPKEQTVVEVAPSGKHHVLRSSPLYPSFLMFKKRHVFRGKFTAKTKANPTGIVGGDNECMKDIKKDNWARMHSVIKKRVVDEHGEELSHNTNSSFSSGESTLVAHPQIADVDVPMADVDYPMAE
ncbi:MAG: hypothetical protein SGILL_008742 [Bacillariaceae sp.]